MGRFSYCAVTVASAVGVVKVLFILTDTKQCSKVILLASPFSKA
ncbi:hypothetical protein JTT01_13930 [Clostridium botulinum]|nr:hypothetical protein [Clostridium botulinum]MCS4523899.1 hypothetical protein [Clostridium botulinum]